MVGIFGQLGQWLADVQGSALLDTEIPFASGSTLGGVMGLDATLVADVISLLESEPNVPAFSSAQALAALIPGITDIEYDDAFAGLGGAAVLTYTFDLSEAFDPLTATIDLDLLGESPLSGLANITTASTVTLTPDTDMGFKLRIDLTPRGEGVTVDADTTLDELTGRVLHDPVKQWDDFAEDDGLGDAIVAGEWRGRITLTPAADSGITQLAIRDADDLGFDAEQALGDRTAAWPLDPIADLARARGLTIHRPQDVDWFRFRLEGNRLAERGTITLEQTGGEGALRIELLDHAGTVLLADAVADGETAATINLSDLETLPQGDYLLRVTHDDADSNAEPTQYDLITAVPGDGEVELDFTGQGTASLDFAIDPAATYYLQVTSANRLPTIYDATLLTSDSDVPVEIDLATRTDFVRRDVIIGGDGHDVLSGGPAEDWIFGGPGNDVLTGGLDYQASDLLFGGTGDDTFQVIPTPLGPESDAGPLTLVDRFDGGEGEDRVLFLGGDTDRLGRPVPDHVAIRYNRFLYRYEFTSLQWDIANQRFVVDENAEVRAKITAAEGAPSDGRLTGDAVFTLRLGETEYGPITVLADATDGTDGTPANESIQDLVADFSAAILAAGLSELFLAGNEGVRLTLASVGYGQDLTLLAPSPAMTDELHFAEGRSANGRELMMYDGTSVKGVADLAPGKFGSAPRDLVPFDGVLFFSAHNAQVGRELFYWNGSASGVALDLAPGSLPYPPYTVRSSSPQYMTVLGGRLVMAATNAQGDRELVAWDGSIKTSWINVHPNGSSNPIGLVAFDGRIYFNANDGIHGYELLRLEGLKPVLAADIRQDGSSSPGAMTPFQGALYFQADDGVHGDEFFCFDPDPTFAYSWYVAGGPYTDPSGYTDPDFHFTPCDAGVYTVTLTVVVEGAGDAYVDRFQVFAGNVLPTIEAGPDAAVDEGQTFERTLTIDDPGCDDWTVTVDWGDGSDPDVVLRSHPDRTVDLAHPYADDGEFPVTVTVEADGEDGAYTDTFTVTVGGVAPSIGLTGHDADEGAAASVDVLITDPSGSLGSGAAGWTFTVDWGRGDGPETFAPHVDFPTQASAHLLHVYDDDGDYEVTVAVTDDDGTEVSDTVILAIANVAPTITSLEGDEALGQGDVGAFGATATDPGADALTFTWDFDDGTAPVVGAENLGLLDIASGSVRLPGGGAGVLVTEALAIGPGAGLDVAESALVVDYTGGASPFATIAGWVASGHAGGTWTGSGIASTAAAAHPQGLTAVGVIDNSDPQLGVGGLTQFHGAAVSVESVLVAYAWSGDANLDGVVDSNDYDRIDTNWLLWTQEGILPEGGWRWSVGDFNYDGIVDSNDYDQIDNAFLLGSGAPHGGAAAPAAATDPAGMTPETHLLLQTPGASPPPEAFDALTRVIRTAEIAAAWADHQAPARAVVRSAGAEAKGLADRRLDAPTPLSVLPGDGAAADGTAAAQDGLVDLLSVPALTVL